MISCRDKVVLTFEMMEARPKKRLAMKLAPEADRCEPLLRREGLVSKITCDFVRRKIDIGEYQQPARRLA